MFEYEGPLDLTEYYVRNTELRESSSDLIRVKVSTKTSVLHSHWSRNVEAWLSLVERIIVLLAPALLCHKEPARASKAPY